MEILQDIILTDNYQKLSYRDNLNDHIVSVLDVASEKIDTDVLTNKDLVFSKRLYNECLVTIYENTTLQLDEQQKIALKTVKQQLYLTFIEKLGTFFNINDNLLIETMDFTVSNYMDCLKYKDVLSYNNPWTYSNNILTQNHLLYSFTDNIDDYKHLLKKNKKESELTKQLTIGVLAKGSREDYTQSYVKDVYALRNLLLNFLDEKNHDRRAPIKLKDIISEFRKMAITENDLSDSHIKSWIVYPLKKFAKLGSNKIGYFIIRSEEDLYESYLSHYNNFTGFYKTLERHKNFAKNSEYILRDFDRHNPL